MKKSILKILAITFLLLALSATGWSQPPQPPAHGQSTNQPSGGAGAPIGDGIFLLLAFSTAYSLRKVYNAQQEEDES